MAKIICSECGATGYSKCPVCRTVFPDNQIEAVLSHSLKYDTSKKGEVTISFKYLAEDMEAIPKEDDVAKALQSAYNTFRMINDEVEGLSFKEYACNHRWVFAPGHKSDIGCGH